MVFFSWNNSQTLIWIRTWMLLATSESTSLTCWTLQFQASFYLKVFFGLSAFLALFQSKAQSQKESFSPFIWAAISMISCRGDCKINGNNGFKDGRRNIDGTLLYYDAFYTPFRMWTTSTCQPYNYSYLRNHTFMHTFFHIVLAAQAWTVQTFDSSWQIICTAREKKDHFLLRL